MKKGVSIFLTLVMLVALLHISVAMHYCEGKEVAATVSLSGKLASCGMTCSETEAPLHGSNFTSHCCDDIVTYCGITCNYSPSYSFLPKLYQFNFQVFAVPAVLAARSHADTCPIYTNVSPPGALTSTDVDLTNICIFRI